MPTFSKIICAVLLFTFSLQTGAIVMRYQYIKSKGKMYYGTDIENATLMKGIHLPSFKQLEGVYAKDKRNLYYAGRYLQKAPKNTIVFNNGYTIVDDEVIYFGSKKICDDDLKSFRIHDSGSRGYKIASDRERVYCDGEIVPLDALSFESIGNGYFKDKDGVYSAQTSNFSKKLDDASPTDYRLYDKFPQFLISNNHVYRDGWETGYNPQGFEIFEHYYAASHGNTVFNDFLLRNNDSICMNNQVLDIDAQSFVFLEKYLVKDKNGVYQLNYSNGRNQYWLDLTRGRFYLNPETTQSATIKIPYKGISYKNSDPYKVSIISDEKKTFYSKTERWTQQAKFEEICHIDLNSLELFCLVGEVAICTDKNSVYCIGESIHDPDESNKFYPVVDLKMNPSTTKLILLGKTNDYNETEIAALKDESKCLIINSDKNRSNYVREIKADHPESIETIFAKIEKKSAFVENPEKADPGTDLSKFSYYFVDNECIVYNRYGDSVKELIMDSCYQRLDAGSYLLRDWEKPRLESLRKTSISTNR